MSKKSIVIAIGDAGKNLLMGCLNDNNSMTNLTDFLVISIGHSIFPGSLPEIVLDGRIEAINRSNIKYIQMLCAENRNVILPFAYEKTAAIIIAGSDPVSIGVVNALSLIFKTEEIITFSFIKEPFQIMRSLTYKNMEDNLLYARATSDFLTVLSNHYYVEGILSMQECFKHMTRLLASVIIDISMICNKDEKKSVEGVGIEIFKEKFENKAYVGSGIAFGDNAAIASTRSALCSTVSNVGIFNPKHILLVLRGDISLLDIGDAVTVIEGISETASIDFVVIYEESENHKVESLILARGINPQYEICR